MTFGARSSVLWSRATRYRTFASIPGLLPLPVSRQPVLCPQTSPDPAKCPLGGGARRPWSKRTAVETPSQIFLVFGWKATTLELGIKPYLNNNAVKKKIVGWYQRHVVQKIQHFPLLGFGLLGASFGTAAPLQGASDPSGPPECGLTLSSRRFAAPPHSRPLRQRPRVPPL